MRFLLIAALLMVAASAGAVDTWSTIDNTSITVNQSTVNHSNIGSVRIDENRSVICYNEAGGNAATRDLKCRVATVNADKTVTYGTEYTGDLNNWQGDNNARMISVFPLHWATGDVGFGVCWADIRDSASHLKMVWGRVEPGSDVIETNSTGSWIEWPQDAAEPAEFTLISTTTRWIDCASPPDRVNGTYQSQVHAVGRRNSNNSWWYDVCQVPIGGTPSCNGTPGVIAPAATNPQNISTAFIGETPAGTGNTATYYISIASIGGTTGTCQVAISSAESGSTTLTPFSPVDCSGLTLTVRSTAILGGPPDSDVTFRFIYAVEIVGNGIWMGTGEVARATGVITWRDFKQVHPETPISGLTERPELLLLSDDRVLLSYILGNGVGTTPRVFQICDVDWASGNFDCGKVHAQSDVPASNTSAQHYSEGALGYLGTDASGADEILAGYVNSAGATRLPHANVITVGSPQDGQLLHATGFEERPDPSGLFDNVTNVGVAFSSVLAGSETLSKPGDAYYLEMSGEVGETFIGEWELDGETGYSLHFELGLPARTAGNAFHLASMDDIADNTQCLLWYSPNASQLRLYQGTPRTWCTSSFNNFTTCTDESDCIAEGTETRPTGVQACKDSAIASIQVPPDDWKSVGSEVVLAVDTLTANTTKCSVRYQGLDFGAVVPTGECTGTFGGTRDGWACSDDVICTVEGPGGTCVPGPYPAAPVRSAKFGYLTTPLRDTRLWIDDLYLVRGFQGTERGRVESIVVNGDDNSVGWTTQNCIGTDFTCVNDRVRLPTGSELSRIQIAGNDNTTQRYETANGFALQGDDIRIIGVGTAGTYVRTDTAAQAFIYWIQGLSNPLTGTRMMDLNDLYLTVPDQQVDQATPTQVFNRNPDGSAWTESDINLMDLAQSNAFWPTNQNAAGIYQDQFLMNVVVEREREPFFDGAVDANLDGEKTFLVDSSSMLDTETMWVPMVSKLQGMDNIYQATTGGKRIVNSVTRICTVESSSGVGRQCDEDADCPDGKCRMMLQEQHWGKCTGAYGWGCRNVRKGIASKMVDYLLFEAACVNCEQESSAYTYNDVNQQDGVCFHVDAAGAPLSKHGQRCQLAGNPEAAVNNFLNSTLGYPKVCFYSDNGRLGWVCSNDADCGTFTGGPAQFNTCDEQGFGAYPVTAPEDKLQAWCITGPFDPDYRPHLNPSFTPPEDPLPKNYNPYQSPDCVGDGVNGLCYGDMNLAAHDWYHRKYMSYFVKVNDPAENEANRCISGDWVGLMCATDADCSYQNSATIAGACQPDAAGVCGLRCNDTSTINQGLPCTGDGDCGGVTNACAVTTRECNDVVGIPVYMWNVIDADWSHSQNYCWERVSGDFAQYYHTMKRLVEEPGLLPSNSRGLYPNSRWQSIDARQEMGRLSRVNDSREYVSGLHMTVKTACDGTKGGDKDCPLYVDNDTGPLCDLNDTSTTPGCSLQIGPTPTTGDLIVSSLIADGCFQGKCTGGQYDDGTACDCHGMTPFEPIPNGSLLLASPGDYATGDSGALGNMALDCTDGCWVEGWLKSKSIANAYRTFLGIQQLNTTDSTGDILFLYASGSGSDRAAFFQFGGSVRDLTSAGYDADVTANTQDWAYVGIGHDPAGQPCRLVALDDQGTLIHEATNSFCSTTTNLANGRYVVVGSNIQSGNPVDEGLFAVRKIQLFDQARTPAEMQADFDVPLHDGGLSPGARCAWALNLDSGTGDAEEFTGNTNCPNLTLEGAATWDADSPFP